MTPPVVATIGTTHPLAFAGLVFAALALADDGARPLCVIAGVSAQTGNSVLAATAIDDATIAAQFASLAGTGVAAFHIGALVSPAAVAAVAAGLAAFPKIPVVLDPVLAASTGEALGSPGVRDALRDLLFPLATLVTPNLAEAAAFTGTAVEEPVAMEAAAHTCRRLGASSALVKGGHLTGDAIDVLADVDGSRTFVSPRIAGSLRGTGDLLAASIAARLARGMRLDDAVIAARKRVAVAIAAGEAFAGTRVARLGREHA